MNHLLLIGIIAALETAWLPAMASAQPPSPAVEQRTPDETQTQDPTKRDPHQYLAAARQQLDAVPTKTLNSDARKKLTRLREDFELLVKNYEGRSLTMPNSANGVAGAAAPVSTDAVDWKLKFDDVERDLTSVLGIGPLPGGSPSPAVAGTGIVASGRQSAPDSSPTQPVGTSSQGTQPVATATPTDQTATGSPTAQAAGSSGANVAGAMSATGAQPIGLAGVAVAEIGVKNLDPGVRTQLEEVRKSVELFFDATTSLQRR
jgi:hypothetical protein